MLYVDCSYVQWLIVESCYSTTAKGHCFGPWTSLVVRNDKGTFGLSDRLLSLLDDDSSEEATDECVDELIDDKVLCRRA